ncbi:MAG: NAD(P)/FAD-dependent oxidoreductase [Candidatus Thermoplasmatota archaeon]|nr:NAD(P)/FAD-dependent oxidoreductase [Candidatus Thermoplasmatota archaeon]
MIYYVVVIGAGPAGLASSIQLKRFGLEPLVLERRAIGGLASNANLIENYLGFPKGIGGKRLVKLFEEQIKKLDIEVMKEEVKKLKVSGKLITIITEKNRFLARSVVLATGTIPKAANIKNEKELAGKRIFYEVAELPPLKKRMRLAIIGSGDAAFDYALNLSAKVSKVDILFRKAVPKALKLLVDRAKKVENIIIHSNTKPLSFEITNNKLAINCITDGKVNIFNCDYAIIAVGRVANLEILDSEMKFENRAEKSGIFFAGDIKRVSLRQVGIAVGDGLIAADKVIKFLRKWK